MNTFLRSTEPRNINAFKCTNTHNNNNGVEKKPSVIPIGRIKRKRDQIPTYQQTIKYVMMHIY